MSSRSRSRRSDSRGENGRESRSRSPRNGRMQSYSPSRSRSRSRDSGPRSAKIVVEKLTKNVNEGHLREIFGSYGDIEELEMPMNRQFLTNRGIAYVLYATPEDAETAIAHMHEAQLDGAVINVSIVLPRRRFSRSPPPRRPPPNRFGESNRYREQPRRQSPPRRRYQRSRSPRRSPSRTPPRRRSRGARRRSPSYSSYSERSRSRSYSRDRRR